MSAAPERLTVALADRYRIERELGAGGMATVYLARDLRHDRPVAIKVLRTQVAEILGAERFLREIRIAARLEHPHILALDDSGEADGLLYYVMPFIDGESLRDRMTREGQLPIGDALRLAAQVADALAYAHKQGVVHRDIKPENILLSGGHAKLADFGIALAADPTHAKLTQTGLAIGTPAYMSPEQVLGDADLDGRSDLYSLGCVLYEMLAGVPPFAGASAQALMAKRFTEDAPHVTMQRPTVPPMVDLVLARALARDPGERHATIGEFGAALLAELSGSSISGSAAAMSGANRSPLRQYDAHRRGGGRGGQGYDLGSLALKGAAIPLLNGVRVIGGVAPQAALGGDGSLLYLRGQAHRAEQEAVWMGRDGRATPVDTSWGFDNAASNPGWALSPDSKRLAIGLRADGRDQIWVKELDRGPVSRITFDSSGDIRPRWMPDGRTVTYLSRRGGADWALYGRNADGTGAEALKLKVSGSIWEAVWSRDGKWLVFRTGEGNRDVYAMQLGVDSVPRPLLATPAQERAVALSPDGRWLAYTSDESGRDEVYVRPFPNVDGGKWQVSLAGGGQPLWAHSGREIFYRSAANEMMVAQVSASPGFAVANRHVLFSSGLDFMDGNYNFTPWDVSPDDQRFLMVRSRAATTDQSAASLILVTNWLAELEAKVKP